MFKVNNKGTRTTPMVSFCYLYCQLWTYFTPCSSVSIVNFEHVIAGWDIKKLDHGLSKKLPVDIVGTSIQVY